MLLKARFQGGALEGQPFTLPIGSVPRGFDVAHGDQVLRYRLLRTGGGEAVYEFTHVTRTPFRSSAVMNLGVPLRAVPLMFYPKAPGDQAPGF